MAHLKNDNEKRHSFYQQYQTLTDETVASERQSRNALLQQIETEQQLLLETEKSSYDFVIVGLVSVLLLSFGIYFFYNRKLNREYAHFESLLQKIASEGQIKPVRDAAYSIQETVYKGIAIPEKTEQFILDKLAEFEKTTYFNNPGISLQSLAKKLNTNTKYLSETIHVHKCKNFNTYINELRINYIIKMMTSDARFLNYKVSYLAETCGFSSHSAFSSVFKSVTDLTPKQFVSFLKKKNEKQ
ncbi:helix-turn-helix domain-containing protein [Flavobacterium caeni]|uniref:helix-turn-helix domain-containing protein n=1 Tax=Flavobacterium caeni TaxID=490189 RepID=UPI00148148CB|nr:helix-turn-helix domain-containing protein [Flavobacterium caeni]